MTDKVKFMKLTRVNGIITEVINMKTFKIHDQSIEARTVYQAYAIRFNCTIASAIADRDFPMTTQECIDVYFESTGNNPNNSEILEMHPETKEYCSEFDNE